jgi:hypothetical protein
VRNNLLSEYRTLEVVIELECHTVGEEMLGERHNILELVIYSLVLGLVVVQKAVEVDVERLGCGWGILERNLVLVYLDRKDLVLRIAVDRQIDLTGNGKWGKKCQIFLDLGEVGRSAKNQMKMSDT